MVQFILQGVQQVRLLMVKVAVAVLTHLLQNLMLTVIKFGPGYLEHRQPILRIQLHQELMVLFMLLVGMEGI